MKRLISDFIDKNTGYIDLSKLNEKDILKTTTFNNNIAFKHGRKKFYFKSANTSGGVNFKNKALYESFISKLLKNYTNTVDYHPAIYKNEKGVVSEHWDNLGKGYMTLKNALDKKKDEYLWIIDSVADFDFSYYNDDLNTFADKECLDEIRKAPIQLMAGNYDFKLSNMAVEYSENKLLNKFLSFDYGFNLFSLVEKYLKSYKLTLTNKNVKYIIDKILNTYFSITLGFGATKNIINYENFDALLEDFSDYAHRDRFFKDNIKQSLTVLDKTNEAFREMEYYNIAFSKHQKDLVKRVINCLSKEYSNIL